MNLNLTKVDEGVKKCENFARQTLYSKGTFQKNVSNMSFVDAKSKIYSKVEDAF